MVVGFVNAGIMSLPQAIGVIMGANIGTTITAQFSITRCWFPCASSIRNRYSYIYVL